MVEVPTNEEVKKIIRICNSKAAEKDGINIDLIKYGEEVLQERVSLRMRY